MFVNCGGFHINEEKLKVIEGVLTKKDTVKISNKKLAGCGGLIIDSDVFKFDNDTHSLTMKETESVSNSIMAPCGGIKLDSEYFEINKNNEVTLKEIVDMSNFMKNSISLSKVTFESLDDFEIVVKDENGKIINPIDDNDKVYKLEKTKLYTYEATNKDNVVVSGNIKTTSRQTNITKTIDF